MAKYRQKIVDAEPCTCALCSPPFGSFKEYKCTLSDGTRRYIPRAEFERLYEPVPEEVMCVGCAAGKACTNPTHEGYAR